MQMENTATGISRDLLSERDFARLSELIQSQTGIKVTGAKKALLESRLHKRLRELGMSGYGQYCDYLFSGEGMENELLNMIDAVSTHKTDFFREPDHFDFLAQHAVPALVRDYGAGTARNLTAWSAACSTGEEPYTIAMVLGEMKRLYRGFRYSVLATDISPGVVKFAGHAVYKEERITPIPVSLREKYLLRSKDPAKKLFRITPELRALVRFGRVNIVEDDYNFGEIPDIIFCRNVMIYFDRQTQEKLLGKLCRKLAPGGYMFLGHSESLCGINGRDLKKVGPSVYRKTDEAY